MTSGRFTLTFNKFNLFCIEFRKKISRVQLKTNTLGNSLLSRQDFLKKPFEVHHLFENSYRQHHTFLLGCVFVSKAAPALRVDSFMLLSKSMLRLLACSSLLRDMWGFRESLVEFLRCSRLISDSLGRTMAVLRRLPWKVSWFVRFVINIFYLLVFVQVESDQEEWTDRLKVKIYASNAV